MAATQVIPSRLPITSVMDVVKARRQGMEMALALGFPRPLATQIAVVISEVGRNIVLYTKGGYINLIPYVGMRTGLKFIAQDQGSNIEISPGVLDGEIDTRHASLGTEGSKEVMDEFDVKSIAGIGTKITGVKWLN